MGTADAPEPPRGARFVTTRWSLVERARCPDPAQARSALDELCAAAWYPLYAYARRRGLEHEEARDATQDLFAELVESEAFARADRSLGRLRTFLLGALQRTLARRAEAGRAHKRGGRTLTLDLEGARARYGQELLDERSPELLFEAVWARDLLARAVERVRNEYAAVGKERLFATLESELAGPTHAPEVLAERLGTTPGAAKVAAHRLRARYHEVVRHAVLSTLEGRGELEDEIGVLLRALARRATESP
jgi:RNA polymerase sigma-70 factor (ECF subfamily)